MKHLLLFLFSIWGISCQTTSVPSLTDLPSVHQEAFKIALDHLENGRYLLAIQKFEKLASQIQSGNVHWSAMYNIGSAYEELHQCKKSENIFSRLATHHNGNKSFEAQALLRLHYAHDCLGQAHRALVVLKDAEKKQRYLTDLTRYVEIPSRLSILYAKLDKPQEAMQFQSIALNGIQRIKAPIKDKKIAIQKVSQLFYTMGKVIVKSNFIKLNQYLSAFPHHQIYLVESYLLDDNKWSPLARKELLSLYQKLWFAYKKLPKKVKKKYQNEIFKQFRDLKKLSLDGESKKLTTLRVFIYNKYLNRFKK